MLPRPRGVRILGSAARPSPSSKIGRSGRLSALHSSARPRAAVANSVHLTWTRRPRAQNFRMSTRCRPLGRTGKIGRFAAYLARATRPQSLVVTSQSTSTTGDAHTSSRVLGAASSPYERHRDHPRRRPRASVDRARSAQALKISAADATALGRQLAQIEAHDGSRLASRYELVTRLGRVVSTSLPQTRPRVMRFTRWLMVRSGSRVSYAARIAPERAPSPPPVVQRQTRKSACQLAS